MENSHDLVIPAMVNPANNNNNAQDQDDDASNNITNNVRHSMRNISDDHTALIIPHRSGHGNHGALNVNSSENMMNHTLNHHHSGGTDNSSWYWQSMLNMMQQQSHMSNNLKIDHGLTIDHHISNNDMLVQGSVADINGACIHPLGEPTASPDTGAMWSQEFL